MKDYTRILESSKRNTQQRIITIGADEKLNEWNILRLIEDMCGRMRAHLDAVIDDPWKQRVGGVKLEFTKVSGKGRRLMLKAQIYRVSNQELSLKVFAHEMLGEGKTARVARATYQIHIERNFQQGKAA